MSRVTRCVDCHVAHSKVAVSDSVRLCPGCVNARIDIGQAKAVARVVARLRRQAEGYALMGKRQVARIISEEADAIERGDWKAGG